MRRLVYAAAARSGRRETARLLGRRGSARSAPLFIGYFACAALALAALLGGRLGSAPPVVESAGRAAGYISVAQVAADVRVVDGDTLVVAGERVRIADIDTPEMPPKARCSAEADGALRARDRLQAMVASGAVELERTGADRYGRTLAYVRVSGTDVGRALVEAGLARRWEGRRRSWCA